MKGPFVPGMDTGGLRPGGRAIDSDETLTSAGPRAQDGDVGLEGTQVVSELRHVPGDLVDETLEVVDEGALEHDELLTSEVEPGEDLREVGVEVAR